MHCLMVNTMNCLVRLCFAVSAAALCAQATAQGVYKCKDAAGKITYAGKECHLLGLMPGGEVTGRASVAPALSTPSPAGPRTPAAEPVAAPAPTEKTGRAPDAEAVVGEDGRRCFKTAKGMRCNDATD